MSHNHHHHNHQQQQKQQQQPAAAAATTNPLQDKGLTQYAPPLPARCQCPPFCPADFHLSTWSVALDIWSFWVAILLTSLSTCGMTCSSQFLFLGRRLHTFKLCVLLDSWFWIPALDVTLGIFLSIPSNKNIWFSCKISNCIYTNLVSIVVWLLSVTWYCTYYGRKSKIFEALRHIAASNLRQR